MRNGIFKFLFVVILFCSSSIKCYADLSLYVGETGYISCPPYSGVLDGISWYSDRPNDISIPIGSNNVSVTITQYFSGTATVECQYAYHYYVGTTKYNKTGHTYYNVTCKKSTVTLNKNQLFLSPGETATLSYSNSSGYRLSDTKVWKTNDKKIATINDMDRDWDGGQSITVKAIKPGKCVITYYAYTGGDNPTCEITVAEVPATNMSFKNETISIKEGKKGSFGLKLLPENSSSVVTWTIADPSIATISSGGIVTGVKAGTTIVTATTDNGLTAKGTVNVIPIPQSISLPYGFEIIEGYSKKLIPILYPENAETTFKWASEDSKIAAIDADGNIKGKIEGTVVIKVETENGKTASGIITIKKPTDGLDHRNVGARLNVIDLLVKRTIDNY